MTSCQDGVVFPCVALSGRDITDAAVAMIKVVPAHEFMAPGACRFQIGKAARREFRAVLGGFEERFDEGVVVRDARPRVRRLDTQPVEHGQHRGGLERAAVIAMQHGLLRQGMDAFGQCGALEQGDSVVSLIAGMNFPADDHPAVEVHDQVQVEPLPLHLGWQVSHVPAPHLAGGRGDVRSRRPGRLWRPATAPMGVLAVGTQHALEARFAGDIDAFVGQRRHDTGRRLVGKAWLIGNGQNPGSFLLGQRVGGYGSRGGRTPVTNRQAAVRLSTLESAHADADHLTGRAQTGTGGMRGLDVLDPGLAIFQADHSSSSLSCWKIASSFLRAPDRAVCLAGISITEIGYPVMDASYS